MESHFSGQFVPSAASSYHSWPRYEGRGGGGSGAAGTAAGGRISRGGGGGGAGLNQGGGGLAASGGATSSSMRGSGGPMRNGFTMGGGGGGGFRGAIRHHHHHPMVGAGGLRMGGGRQGPGGGPGGPPRFQYGRVMKNKQFPRSRHFEFRKLPDTAKFKEFTVSPDNLVCFSGFQNVFTAQHDFPLQIDGRLYDNVNHFYQLAKTEALCGVTSLLMTDSDEAGSNSAGGGGTTKEKTKDYNTLARNILKINKVDKSAAEEWRKTAGLEAMQRALLAKVEQCDELRKALLDSGDKLLVHCFGGDDFYASACNGRYIQDWARSMSNNKVVIKIPLDFPLTSETVLSVPKFGLGRNALGVIYMQLREMLRDGLLPYKGVLKEECDEQNNHSMDILNQQDEEGGGPSVVPSVPAPIKGESRDSDMGDGFAMDGSPI